jgi:DNA-binding NtrC family response regulator
LFPAAPANFPVGDVTRTLAIPRGDGELILVANDDAGVRDVTCATLIAHGYRVLAAADGAEAVGLFAMRSHEFRVLITDLDMPNLDGVALSRIATTLNPSIRTLLVSGSTDIHDSRRKPLSNGRFLAKPFSAEQLLSTVHDLLGEHRERGDETAGPRDAGKSDPGLHGIK